MAKETTQKKIRFAVSLPEDLNEQYEAHCRRLNRSKDAQTVHLIKKFLEEENNRKQK